VKRGGWLRRLGGAGGVGICVVPMLLLYALLPKAASSFKGAPLLDLLFLATGGHRTHGPLLVHIGSHMTCDLGLVLAMVPAAVTIWLLAPLAEYRRRDALMAWVPVWNLYITAKICARIVDAASADSALTPETIRLPSSR
jgi:hypothetical protein